VTPLARKIAARIGAAGPLPFSEFMRLALYDSEHGYYLGHPFGPTGDFYTAAQLQPVFGAYVSTLAASLQPGYSAFVDIGAGRADLAASFPQNIYHQIEFSQSLPKTKNAILFSNELFDALPVDLYQQDVLLRVTRQGDEFRWYPHPPREGVREVRPQVEPLLTAAFHSLESGSWIIIDYGYRQREWVRFPNGSLMSYRRHLASNEVLLHPGERDITAHVDWDHLIAAARSAGWSLRSFTTLRDSLMGLGPDVLEGLNLLGQMHLRTLLFSFGESFDVLILDKK
jgi:SAM-dependent MidA family methyltransferase